MASDQLAARAEALRRSIDRWNYEYYVLDQPTASDAEYDEAMNELRAIEAEHPELVTPDHPPSGSARAAIGVRKVDHPVPMLSLSNVFSEDELQGLGDQRASGSPAATTGLRHRTEDRRPRGRAHLCGWVLDHGATRGDGFVGEDITANSADDQDDSAPPARAEESDPAASRCAARSTCAKRTSSASTSESSPTAAKPFMNPRNSAAGSLRQLDPDHGLASAALFAYGIGYVAAVRSCRPPMRRRLAAAAIDFGFDTSPCANTVRPIDEVWERCQWWQERRNDLDFEIDGVVIKVNDVRLQEEIGYVAREPRWATAYKFPAIQKTTVVEDIADQRRPHRHAQPARRSWSRSTSAA